MKKNFVFIANWKMYLNFDEEINFVTSKYDDFVQLAENTKDEIILCPSSLSLAAITQIFKTTKISTGGQNCSAHSKGAFTGQMLAENLNLIGSKFCIIGHSECRKYLNENETEIAQKLTKLINNKISPILCIGESEQDYKANKTISTLEKQLENIEKIIKDYSNMSPCISINIAYEPIWSIGTGKVATVDHLETIFAWTYKKIQKIDTNTKFRLIYGGSVNSKNISGLKKINHLDGFLVGNASLDFQEFKKIVKSDN